MGIPVLRKRINTMKRKSINGTGWEFLDAYSSQYIHIDGIYSEYISMKNGVLVQYIIGKMK